MPAPLPGESKTVNGTGNPSLGNPVIFDLLSGPKGSPKDKDTTGNASTGALSTGIGFGQEVVISPQSSPLYSNAVYGIRRAGFTDDYKPGISTPLPADSADSKYMYIGGGKNSIVAGSGANGNGYPAAWKVSVPVPYTAGFGIGGAGAGGSRDAGAGPAFTGFGLKMVTAPGAVAIGAVVEAGWTNRSGVAMVADQSTFGSAVAASAAPA